MTLRNDAFDTVTRLIVKHRVSIIYKWFVLDITCVHASGSCGDSGFPYCHPRAVPPKTPAATGPYSHGNLSYRLTQAGLLRALSFPAFFRSTSLGSRVKQPPAAQVVRIDSRGDLETGGSYLDANKASGPARGSAELFATANAMASDWPVVPPPFAIAQTLYLSILCVIARGQMALSRS